MNDGPSLRNRFAASLLVAVAACLGSAALAYDARDLTARDAIDFSPGRPLLSVAERCSSTRHYQPTSREIAFCTNKLRPEFERAIDDRIDAEIDRIERLDRNLATYEREKVGKVPDLGLTRDEDKARADARYRSALQPIFDEVADGIVDLIDDAMGRDRYSRDLHVLLATHCGHRVLLTDDLSDKLTRACSSGIARIRRTACVLGRNAVPHDAALLLPSRRSPIELGEIACRSAMDGYSLALEDVGLILKSTRLVVTSDVHGGTVATLDLDRDSRDGSLKPSSDKGRVGTMETSAFLECLSGSEHLPGLPPVSDECRTWKSANHSAPSTSRRLR